MASEAATRLARPHPTTPSAYPLGIHYGWGQAWLSWSHKAGVQTAVSGDSTYSYFCVKDLQPWYLPVCTQLPEGSCHSMPPFFTVFFKRYLLDLNAVKQSITGFSHPSGHNRGTGYFLVMKITKSWWFAPSIALQERLFNKKCSYICNKCCYDWSLF